MSKPVLYLDIVGTLLLEKGGEMEMAPFAQQFVDGVRDAFEIRFLTSLEEHQAQRVGEKLGIQPAYVPFRHALGKASALRFDENFFWVDDDPNPADLLRLSDERCSDRLIPVSRREGVTEATLRKLFATLDDRRASGD
ncbi:MAG: hypothetical protein CMJ83_00560 [Planctomycetes bacterium]|nr:hypothetical protein [Planctomycetota bacterium]